ncbi:hypothetical protein OE88DRAFT_1651254 [Heliocybe sulcata]|uniref:Chalcone isomerase domain-containing protein n=1 Tax=Heliocybe sulcata TaxID=5364 RepID=A0A5C3NUS2_9AGAM|nr:hypothetical protein OE88DRAFT_1651254 [Heliocybe sulcata]
MLQGLVAGTAVASRSSTLARFRRGRDFHSARTSSRLLARPFVWGAAIGLASLWVLHRQTLHLDAEPPVRSEETRVDPATSIEFPTTLVIPSKVPLPKFTLVGVGVRTVSFLRVKVYSIGFYADLSNPNLNIPKTATPEEKIEHIVQNTACVLRIIPTRSTSYGHLRDGFMRALQGRMRLLQQQGSLTPAEEASAQPPLRQLKSIFPNTPLAKHSPLDVLLTAPEPAKPRTLVFRDLGVVQNDWVAKHFVLAYFAGDGLSPPLKQSVVTALEGFGR